MFNTTEKKTTLKLKNCDVGILGLQKQQHMNWKNIIIITVVIYPAIKSDNHSLLYIWKNGLLDKWNGSSLFWLRSRIILSMPSIQSNVQCPNNRIGIQQQTHNHPFVYNYKHTMICGISKAADGHDQQQQQQYNSGQRKSRRSASINSKYPVPATHMGVPDLPSSCLLCCYVCECLIPYPWPSWHRSTESFLSVVVV